MTAKKRASKLTPEQASQWERTVGKAMIELHEEYLRHSMGKEAADWFLCHQDETSNDPLTNLRRKLRRS